MKLNDYSKEDIDKKTFLEWCDRCMALGLTICEDARFSIEKSNYIRLDISEVTDSYVKIPSFVNEIYSLEYKRNGWVRSVINSNVKTLDLNKVRTISTFGLSGFNFLQTLKGHYLYNIGLEGLRGCGCLTEVDFPYLKYLGEKSLMFTSLKSLRLPRLQIMGDLALQYTRLEELYAPQLTKVPILKNGYSPTHVLKLCVAEDCKIYENQILFKNFYDDTIYAWNGKNMISQRYGNSYRYHVDTESVGLETFLDNKTGEFYVKTSIYSEK